MAKMLRPLPRPLRRLEMGPSRPKAMAPWTPTLPWLRWEASTCRPCKTRQVCRRSVHVALGCWLRVAALARAHACSGADSVARGRHAAALPQCSGSRSGRSQLAVVDMVDSPGLFMCAVVSVTCRLRGACAITRSQGP